MDTFLNIGEFKGNAMFQIVKESDRDKVEAGEAFYPVISFGGAKANELVKFITELQKFAEENQPMSKEAKAEAKAKAKLIELAKSAYPNMTDEQINAMLSGASAKK